MDTLIGWLDDLSLFAVPCMALAVFFGRSYINARIGNSVKHTFNVQLEELRSDLRQKETQLADLRSSVLSGSFSRSDVLFRRKVVAAENLWKSVVEYGAFKTLSGMIAGFDLEVIRKRYKDSPKYQKVFQTIVKSAPEKDTAYVFSKYDRPFVSETVWAYYSAYKAILMYNYAHAHVLANGIPDIELMDDKPVRRLVSAVFPENAKAFEEFDATDFHHLLDDIESKILLELQLMLEGRIADKESYLQAAEIMRLIQEGSKEKSTEPEVPTE